MSKCETKPCCILCKYHIKGGKMFECLLEYPEPIYEHKIRMSFERGEG